MMECESQREVQYAAEHYLIMGHLVFYYILSSPEPWWYWFPRERTPFEYQIPIGDPKIDKRKLKINNMECGAAENGDKERGVINVEAEKISIMIS